MSVQEFAFYSMIGLITGFTGSFFWNWWYQ